LRDKKVSGDINNRRYAMGEPFQSGEWAGRGTGGRSYRRSNVVLWLFLVVLVGLVLYRYMENRCNIGLGFVINTQNAEKLADKINPNRATWASLARLPGIGQSKAMAIVEYRQEYWRNSGGENVAFARSEDLCNVKGIGEVTVEGIKEYLVFDEVSGADRL